MEAVAVKTCSKCRVPKALTEFYLHRKSKDGRAYRCKSCSKAAATAWNQAHPERHLERSRAWNRTHPERHLQHTQNWEKSNPDKLKAARRRADLKRSYGITETAYTRLSLLQGESCKICGVHQSALSYPLCVDHDHVTGVVRGLLCKLCNSGLGQFRDDTARLQKAITYLRSVTHA